MPAKELVSVTDTADLYETATGLIERSAAAYASGVPDGAGDDGFFGTASVTWRMSADLASPVAGLRSLLMQALHPLARAGVDQHSGWRRDPVGRLAATTAYLTAVTFGERAMVKQAAARSELLAWVPAGWRTVGCLNVKGTEHELACQLDLHLGDTQPDGSPRILVAGSWVIDSRWITSQRIPALGRRVVMTCSFSLQPDM